MSALAISKLSGRERLGLILAALFVSVFVVKFAVMKPIGEMISDLDQRIADTEQTIEYQQIVTDPARKQQVQDAYDTLRQHLLEPASSAEIVNEMQGEIERLAEIAAVLLPSSAPVELPEKPFYKEYAVQIEVEATMENLMTFLYELQKSPQLLRAESFSITPKKKGSANLVRVRASFLITRIVTSEE